MRYFEFLEPYYALIQGGNTEEAEKTYLEVVSDEVEAPPIEIDRDRALLLFSKGLSESGESLSIDEVLTDFCDEKNKLLLIDGALI